MELIQIYHITARCPSMPDKNTLGEFLSQLLHERRLSNRALAQGANISESVIRNMLQHGVSPNAKDPDARTLRAVADYLDVDPTLLFRLVGYIPPKATAVSPRAEYLARVFDKLLPEQQAAIMGVLQTFADTYTVKEVIARMRDNPSKALSGFDVGSTYIHRTVANQLITQMQLTEPRTATEDRIPLDFKTLTGVTWSEMPTGAKKRIMALVREKLSLDFEPTMVDPEWRKND